MPKIIHNSITQRYPSCLYNMYLYMTETHKYNIYTCATLGIVFVAAS